MKEIDCDAGSHAVSISALVTGDDKGEATGGMPPASAEDRSAILAPPMNSSGSAIDKEPSRALPTQADESASAEAPRGSRLILHLKRPVAMGPCGNHSRAGVRKRYLSRKLGDGRRRPPRSRNCLRRARCIVAAVKRPRPRFPSPWRHRLLMSSRSPPRRTCRPPATSGQQGAAQDLRRPDWVARFRRPSPRAGF